MVQERLPCGAPPVGILAREARGPEGIAIAPWIEAQQDDSARLVAEAQVRAAPDDPQRHVLLGLTLAYLGRKMEAEREGKRGVELLPISRDGYGGPYNQLQLVRIYLLTGEPDLALDQLEPLLRVPYYLSPGWLRIDPTFAPLKGNPRFERLIAAK